MSRPRVSSRRCRALGRSEPVGTRRDARLIGTVLRTIPAGLAHRFAPFCISALGRPEKDPATDAGGERDGRAGAMTSPQAARGAAVRPVALAFRASYTSSLLHALP